MKKHFAFASCLILVLAVISLVACAKNSKVMDSEMFRTKSGVIGVFRQPAFYCSEASPQFVKLGDSIVEVKPTWSENQDNVFVTEQKPGLAKLYYYEYTCGDNKSKFALDTTENSKKPGPIGVMVPEQGFCKTVISFVEGDKLFSQNDALLLEHFEKSKVAAGFHNIPYCDVIDNRGSKISFADKDSIIDAQFQAAITDAAEALPDEIHPLVVINTASDMITWDADKSRVLVIAFHNEPQAYPEGETVKLSKNVWVVGEKELYSWYQSHKDGVKDWNLRWNQVMGLPRTSAMSHFSAFWVEPQNLIRPAFITDIQKDSMEVALDERFEDYSSEQEFKVWYKNWFDKNRARSYRKKDGLPWTRLGYSYDWGSKGDKYGLSEFLTLDDAEVRVLFTKNIPTFMKWLEERK